MNEHKQPSHVWFGSFTALAMNPILFAGASGTTITVVNDCGFIVWPGISGKPGFSTTGFELKIGGSRSLQAPANWSGSFWGRTGCSFNESGSGLCATGDCGGEIECKGKSATSAVILAVFNLSQTLDHYDVSIMDNFSVQMIVEVSGGSGFCAKKGCIDNFERGCRRSSPNKSGDRNNDFTCKGGDYTIRFCPPRDTFSSLKLGRELKSNDQLVSIGGDFTLGFFHDDMSYLGIWYTGDVKAKKVWVANRNTPIISTSGIHALAIDPNTGNLIITARGTILMNLTDVQAGPNPKLKATLEDTGNLRLINEVDKRVLWESFDHPTDVLLPGMKLGYDNTTGKNWTLTSWFSDIIPREGAFTLSWDAIDEAAQRLTIRRRGQRYWTSGNRTNRSFQYMHVLNNPQISWHYNLTPVFNNEQRYFSYNESNWFFPMWVLKQTGEIRDGDDYYLSPDLCYGYNSDDGCEETLNMPQCRGKNDYFFNLKGDFDPIMTTNDTDRNLSLSISDCFDKCWNDCRCVGYYSYNNDGTGCVFWRGKNSFSSSDRDDVTLKYVIFSDNSSDQRTGNKTKKNTSLRWILVIGVGIPLGSISAGLLWYVKKRKHRREEGERRERDESFLELTATESFKDLYQLGTNGEKGNNLLVFSFATIMAATRDFSIENKLGQGGFGPVYKGKLSDGQEIAIKRLSKTSRQGLLEFKNELILISKLQHTNLVRVLGCCIHEEEYMLIYEYMPNKSLDFFLFDENRKVELDWPKRFNIIEGIAQGLLYLHKYSRMRVIHRDLKAGNILLDDNMNPKISDFGIAKIFKHDETQAKTRKVIGTFGYMAPEYAMEGTLSVKSDIFSFGVLILEIVTGRRNSSFTHLERIYNVIGYAWDLWQQGNVLGLQDPTLGSTCDVQQLLRTIHVALLCVQESATNRPTTSELISMLFNDTISLPTPNKPLFAIGRAHSMSSSRERELKDLCTNDMTITTIDGK